MKKTKKALATLAIAGMVMTSVPFNALADNTATTRIYGNDRIQTAVNVAKAGWTTANTVIVAPSADANLVDALAAAPLAGQDNAPILLTAGAALDAQTKQAIMDLKATKVIAVGALSDQVVNDLQAISGVTVQQLKGTDRIDTASKIAAQLTAPAGTFVVGYGALADALSVASYAAANKYEILVANPDGSLPSSEVPVGTKYVIGGPTLVNDGAVVGANRIYGQDRYDTNNQVIQALGSKFDTVFLANGENGHLVDSLVASAYAAKTNSVIALTDNSTVKANDFLGTKMSDSSVTVALGGEGVVSETVRAAVKKGTTTPPQTGDITVTGTATPGRSVAEGERLIKVATLNVSAATAGQITGVKMSRTGLSSDNDVSSLVVYDGANRLNIPAVIGNGVADFDFTSPLQLTAGQTKTLDVYMNVSGGSGSGKQIVLSIDQVRGASNFTPVASNLFTTAVVTLGALQVTEGSGAPSANLDPNGQSATIDKYKFAATGEDIVLNRVVLTQSGSAGSADIKDFTLWNGSTQLSGPVALGSDRTVVFTIPSGLKIANGDSATLDVKATVAGGSTRTVQLDVQNDVDVMGVGQTYGTNIVGTVQNGTLRTINQGKLIISRDTSSPTAADIKVGGKAIEFGDVKVQAVGEPIQLRTIVINSLVDGLVTKNLDLTNVKLISNGTTIGSDSAGFVVANSNYDVVTGNLTMQLAKPLTVNPDTPVVISVQADTKAQSTPLAGTDLVNTDTVVMSVVGVKEFARMTSGNTVTAFTVAPDLTNPVANVAFNTMTIGAQGITADPVAAAAQNVYPSQINATLASFDLSDNLTNTVNVNSVYLAETNGFSDFSNLKITDKDGKVISNIESSPANGRLTFDTPLAIANGAKVRINVVADVRTGANTAHTSQITMGGNGVSGQDIDATDSVTGNSVGVKTTGDILDGVVSTISGSVLTHFTAPVYSTKFDIHKYYNAQTTAKDVKLGGWKIGNDALGSNEMVTINKINFTKEDSVALTTMLPNDKFSNLRVVDSAGNVLGTVATMAQGATTVEITLDKPLDIDYGKTADVALMADINAGSDEYGDILQFAMGTGAAGFKAQTKYTGLNADYAFAPVYSTDAGAADNSNVVVAPTTLNVAAVDVPNPTVTVAAGPAKANSLIAKFTFTNNGNNVAYVQHLALTDTLGTLGAAGVIVYKASDGTAISTTGVGGAGTIAAASEADVTLTSPLRVDPGQSETILVRLGTNVGTLASGDNIALRVVDIGASGNSDYSDTVGGALLFHNDTNATMNAMSFVNP